MRLSTGSVEPNVRPTGWSEHELALFSRAAKLLSSGGLRIETGACPRCYQTAQQLPRWGNTTIGRQPGLQPRIDQTC